MNELQEKIRQLEERIRELERKVQKIENVLKSAGGQLLALKNPESER